MMRVYASAERVAEASQYCKKHLLLSPRAVENSIDFENEEEFIHALELGVFCCTNSRFSFAAAGPPEWLPRGAIPPSQPITPFSNAE